MINLKVSALSSGVIFETIVGEEDPRQRDGNGVNLQVPVGTVAKLHYFTGFIKYYNYNIKLLQVSLHYAKQ